MTIKKGKQVMIDEYNDFNVVTGTVDNKNPKSLYVIISAWADPLIDDEINYKGIIRELKKNIKKEIYENLDSNLFNIKRTIIDFDMRESGIVYGKKSYMSCEMTFFQKHNFKIQEKIIQDELNNLLSNQINKILKDSKHFKFNKNKK